MPSITVEYTSEAERLVLEQAVAFVSQMRATAADAEHGGVLDACERLALSDGRRLLRDSLAAALQSRIDSEDAQKKSAAGPRAGGDAG